MIGASGSGGRWKIRDTEELFSIPILHTYQNLNPQVLCREGHGGEVTEWLSEVWPSMHPSSLLVTQNGHYFKEDQDKPSAFWAGLTFTSKRPGTHIPEGGHCPGMDEMEGFHLPPKGLEHVSPRGAIIQAWTRWKANNGVSVVSTPADVYSELSPGRGKREKRTGFTAINKIKTWAFLEVHFFLVLNHGNIFSSGQ